MKLPPGSKPSQAPNPQPGQPFLWEQSPLAHRFGQPLEQGQLDSCIQFSQNRPVSGPLSATERADLMAQLGLQQAHQNILDPSDFAGRTTGSVPTLYNNFPAALLAPTNSFLIASFSYPCMQRLEFADPELWVRLMDERAYLQANNAPSSTYMDTAYDVYVAASELIAATDDDYVGDQGGRDEHLLH